MLDMARPLKRQQLAYYALDFGLELLFRLCGSSSAKPSSSSSRSDMAFG